MTYRGLDRISYDDSGNQITRGASNGEDALGYDAANRMTPMNKQAHTWI